ncbi:hypothetical protein C3L33_13988, partial [Rhododendron williamsianum]
MAFMQQFKETKSVAKRSKKYLEEALYKRLFKEGGSEVSVRQQLNQFLKSRKRVYKWEVGHSLKILRSRNRFYPALKVSIHTIFFSLALCLGFRFSVVSKCFNPDGMEAEIKLRGHLWGLLQEVADLNYLTLKLISLRACGTSIGLYKDNQYRGLLQISSDLVGRTFRNYGRKGYEQDLSDHAIHLDLIAKARGVPAAEAYFINLPETSKNHLTYGLF